jgi:hypothetical protein
MPAAEGYDYRRHPTGAVHIFHHGKLATMLKGDAAAEFESALADGDPQEVMASFADSRQRSRPGTGPQGAVSHLGGNGAAHAPQQFRRKSV